MTGKHGLDLSFACLRQMDVDHPAVICVALPANQSIAFEVIDHQGQIASTFQDLLADLSRRHGTKVVQGLQDRKLGKRQIADRISFRNPCH